MSPGSAIFEATQVTGPQAPIRIGPMSSEHLAGAHRLSTALNWPYRADDWRFALQLGTGIAAESADELVGTALWWPYEERFATCGMIIVSGTCQHQGIGARLMEELLRQTSGRAMLLCSTREGRRLYERLGFVQTGHVRQHQATLTAPAAVPTTVNVRDFASADLRAVVELDRRAAGMGRARLLEALLQIGRFVVLERTAGLAGYACLRPWGRGHVIGPVIAADAQGARALIARQLSGQVGQFVRIDVTEACGLSPWLSEIGLGCVDAVTTMIRGEPPEPATDATLFALANQSFG
jgi:GNAT superfamily N-acetyltransferase